MTVTLFNAGVRCAEENGRASREFLQWLRTLVDQSNYALTFEAVKAALATADSDIALNGWGIVTGAGSELTPALVIGALANGGMYSTSNTLYWTTNGTTRMRLNGGNLFVYGAVGITNGNVFLYADASGKLTLSDVDDDGFDILRLGGNTSSFPAIQRSGAALRTRLADNSADACHFVAAPTAGGHATNKTYVDALVAAGAILFSQLQNFDALSVLGRSANSSGVGDEIAAGTDGHILRRSGTTLGFGKILTNFITGTSTNDSATAGDIGEYLEASAAFGSVGSWTTATNKNITSLALAAGDYLVEGFVAWSGGAITGTYSRASLNTTSATHDTSFQAVSPTMSTAASSHCYAVPTRRVSLSASGTVYLVGDIGFTAGTPAAGGAIRAWRVR